MVRLQNPVGLGRAKGYGMERQSDETSRESDYLSPGDEQFVFVTPRRKRAFSLWTTRAEAEHALNSIMSQGHLMEGGDGCQVRSQVP